MLKRLLAAGALALASSLLLAPSAMAEDETASVSVFHAIPDVPVDIYANGEELLMDFQPGTITDPLKLPAGEYEIIVVKAGTGIDGGERVYEGIGYEVAAGSNVTLVAHPNNGNPTVDSFDNDTSASDKGGRLTVRHVATAPAVDIRAGGTVAIPALESPDEAKLNIAPGTLNVDVTAAGTDTVVLGPVDVTVEDGKNTIVYAWGSLEDENLALATQSVDLQKATTEPSASPNPSTQPTASPSKPAKPGMPSTGAEGPGSSAGTTAALLGVASIAGLAVLATRRQLRVKA